MMGQHQSKKMIIVNDDSDYSSSDNDNECNPPFQFTLPECTLPHFINTTTKWAACVYETNNLHLWCELLKKIEGCSPLDISEEEVKIVIKCMAEDIVYMHGMTKFFPTGFCTDCGVVHSVSIFYFIK